MCAPHLCGKLSYVHMTLPPYHSLSALRTLFLSLILQLKFLSFWRFLNFFRAQFACEFAAVCSPENFVPSACCSVPLSHCPSCQSLLPSSVRPSVRQPTASCACLLLHDCHLAVGCRPSTPHDPLGYAADAAPSPWSFRAVFLSFFMRR